jgi:FkbM family methyltransferase
LKRLLRRSGYLIRARSESEVASASLHRVTHQDKIFNLLVLNPDDGVQKAHVAGHLYEREEIDIMEKYFSGGNFIDVGANVGNHTVYFASLPATSQVFSFEPHPEAFAMLSFNVAFNGLRRKTTLHNIALSNVSQDWMLKTPLNNLGGSTLESEIRGAERRTRSFHCSSVTGDAVISDAVGFVKIDVEGHEVACLEGLAQTLKKSRPPVFIEVAPQTEEVVSEFMAQLGFKERLRYQRYEVAVNILFLHSR